MKLRVNNRKGMKVFGFALMALGLATAHTYSATTYPDMPYAGPTPMPTFPPAFTAFDPSVSNYSPNASAPAIAEWTRSNNPGNTMVIAADNIGTGAAQVSFSDGSTNVYNGSIRRQNDRTMAVTLPALPGNTMYLMWPRNASGYGQPVGINQTEAWWVGFDKVARGGTFSVYGRNLALGSGACHLYIDGYGWITSTKSNPYKADFTVPTDLAAGTYTIYAHNGHGRKYGFSEALTLHVENPYSWNANVYDVTAYGANGTDGNPDDAGIAAAIAASDAHPGSTVYFPAGTYYTVDHVRFNDNKKIVGVGMGATIIKPAAGYAGTEAYMKIGNNTVLSNLTLQATSALNWEDFLHIGWMHDIVIANVEITGQYNTGEARTLLDCTEASYVEVKGCKFIIGRDVFVADMQQARFTDCEFLGIRDCNQLMAFKGAKNIDMSNCTAGNFNESDITDGFGWCKGRWVAGTGPSSFCYFGGNTSSNMLPRLDPAKGRFDPGQPDQNSGEQFLFEGLAARYKGSPIGVSPSSLRFNSFSWNSAPSVATITGGKGIGQSRVISYIDGGSGVVNLAKPWNVLPDTNSVISLGTYLNHVVAYGNHLDGRPRAATEPLTGELTASTAWASYGGAFNIVVSDNIGTELGSGFANTSVADSDISTFYDVAPPNYFNVYQNNVADYCYIGFSENFFSANKYRGVPLDGPEPAMLGNVYRNNVATNMVGSGFTISADYTPGYVVMDVYDVPPKDVDSSPSVEAEQVWVETAAVTPPPPDGPPAPVLTGIAISGLASLNEGNTVQYGCTAAYSDGTTATVAASWSEDSAYATISASGLLSAGDVSADQGVTVTASYGGKTATLAVTIKYVPVLLTGISITGTASLNEETTAQYSCTASYSDGSSAVVVPAWSENSAYATINASGLLSAGNVTADQNLTVTASFGGKTAAKAVVVKYVPPTLASIAISGVSSFNEQTTAQYTCMANYSDGTSAVVVPAWSENSAYTTISASGLLSAGNVAGDQNVTITASSGGKTATKAVVIKYVAPTLASIAITGPVVVDEESSAQYTCTATYSDGTSAVVVPAWTQNSGYASIDAAGLLVTGNVTVDQNFTITASFGGLVDTYAVTLAYVAPPVVLTGIVIEGPAILEENTTTQLVCTVTYSDGTSAVVVPTWSENSTYTTINAAGLLSAGNVATDQSVTITATFGGKVATQSLTLLMVGTQITYPLSGFAGQRILAELWDDAAQSWRTLGEAVGPDELVIGDMNAGQWYWLRIKQYDDASGLWVRVHGNWISM